MIRLNQLRRDYEHLQAQHAELQGTHARETKLLTNLAEGYRRAWQDAERENQQLRHERHGARELIRELGSAWRADDPARAGTALARLENAVDVHEQGAP